MTVSPAERGSFGKKVAGVFSTKVAAFSLSFGTSLMVSFILGPDGRGAYLNLISVSGLAGAIGVFGLPSAVNYFSARNGSVKGLLLAGIAFTTCLSIGLMLVLWILMPWLATNVFSVAAKTNREQLYWMLLVVPPALLTTFAMAALIGRQQVRTYTSILLLQGVMTFAMTTLLVAVFGLGVSGAILATAVVIWAIALIDVVAVIRLGRREPGGRPISIRAMVSYGLRVYPASITGYFNYRVDNYLIPVFLVADQAALGWYGQAVTMAELLFYIPDSIATIFLPRVAGLSDQEAKTLLARVSRLTVLLTGLAALAIIPVAYAGIHVVLPMFTNSLPVCYVLLPGVMALSLSKVMSSYAAGRGRPGPTSIGSTLAVIAHVAATIVLIPRFGILGAALAADVSYGVSAVFMLIVARRISGCSIRSMIVPGREEVVWVVATSRRVAGRVLAAVRRPRAAAPGHSTEAPK
jgi:O-antigen/teichoic acid export membrane protein